MRPYFTHAFAADAGAVTAVLAGQKAVRTIELTLPAGKIDCGNGTMDEHMRKVLKVETAPAIEFKLSG